jgi:hypothetical protein
MKEIIVENCPACEPISNMIEVLVAKGFTIKEQKLSDYHFKELYFLLVGDITLIQNNLVEGINQVENKLICSCHWSTIELKDNK